MIAGSGWRLTVPAAASADDPWQLADQIVRNTRRPRIPGRQADITAYGAVGDGATDCTQAFKAAIADLTRHGGGRVVVPPGRYLTGAIHLESRIELHVQKDATIVFSTDPKAYMPVMLLATVPIDDRVSLYARWGDWLPWSCWGLVLGAFLAVRLRSLSAKMKT